MRTLAEGPGMNLGDWCPVSITDPGGEFGQAGSRAIVRGQWAAENSAMIMIIALITIKSILVPLIEGLCAQIHFRSEILVGLLTSSSFLFCERKTC